jgi:hypothetical protein
MRGISKEPPIVILSGLISEDMTETSMAVYVVQTDCTRSGGFAW